MFRELRSDSIKQPFFVFVCLLAIVLGIILRIRGISDVNLREDEIYSVTHAVQDFWTFLVNVIRNDIHPHLYYFQLYLWAKASNSDQWFFLNSFLWGIAAIAAVWLVGRRFYGELAGLTSAAVLSLVPMAIFLSQTVRMYPMLMAFTVATFFVVEQTMVRARQSFSGRYRLAFFGLNLILIYSHILGVMPVFFIGLYGLHGIFLRGKNHKELGNWCFAYFLLVLLSAPVIALALAHESDPSMYRSLRDLETALRSIASLSVGGNSFRSDLIFGIGLVLCFSVALIGLRQKSSRRMTLWLLVGPVLLAFFAGLVFKPVFKPPIFASLFLPISALIVGRYVSDFRTRHSLKLWAAKCDLWTTAGFALLFLCYLLALDSERKSTDFKAAALLISDDLQAGDVIYAPDRSMFWGVNWYLAGPEWGSPLVIAESPNERWKTLYDGLGSEVVEALNFSPRSPLLEYRDAQIVTGYGELPRVVRGDRIWLITYWNRPVVSIPEELFIPILSEEFGGMRVQRFDRTK